MYLVLNAMILINGIYCALIPCRSPAAKRFDAGVRNPEDFR